MVGGIEKDMINYNRQYTNNLSEILNRINYVFVLKNIRGSSDFFDPWYNFDMMEKLLNTLDIRYKNAFRLLYLGQRVPYRDLVEELSEEQIDSMIKAKIWIMDSGYVKTNNLVVLVYEGLKILTEINPWYSTCIKNNTDVYIGIDSLRLAENIHFKKDAIVLDLCSGTGIQGIIAARSAQKVVSVEINEKAASVTQFNIALNGLENIIELRKGNLYDVLDDEKFDYIYANPPFIPMISDVNYPICGAGGEDGLMILNNIFERLNIYLKVGGEAIVFCQCLGDEKKIFFNEKVKDLCERNNQDVLCLMQDRIPLEYQLRTLTSLTKLFNADFDESNFERKMSKIYNKLNAKYLYSILYQIKQKQNGGGELSLLQFESKWDANSHAKENKAVNIVTDNESYVISDLSMKRIGYIDQEAFDIYSLLKNDKSVSDITNELYDKYKQKSKYSRFGKPSFLCAVLDNCLRMEQLGLIRRV